MLDGYFGLTFSQKKNAFYINVKVTQFFWFKGKKERELEEEMAVLEQKFLGKIFFSNFDPGW